MHILALGLNHVTADLPLRERLAFPAELADAALADLRDWLPASAPEAALLSTCNRTEIYCATRDADTAQELLLQWIAKRALRPPAEVRPHVYALTGRRAVLHAFRVASGLDSMVLGETQILGQMKRAVRRAHLADALGPHLHHLFQRAFAVAKQVRRTTGIGGAAVSLAAAAVRLAEEAHGDLRLARVLFVGAGEMIELAARHFGARLPADMAVATRSAARAGRLAARCPVRLLDLASVPDELEHFDVVVSGTASVLPVIGLGMVERAMRVRRSRPLVMIDFAVPRDIEPQVALLPGVVLHAVDDLARIVECGYAARRAAAAEAEAIIEGRADACMQWLSARRLLPLMHTLEQRAVSLRRIEVARARRRLVHGDTAEAVLDSLAAALINKFLHTARTQLGRGELTPEAAQRLVEHWLPGLSAVECASALQASPENPSRPATAARKVA